LLRVQARNNTVSVVVFNDGFYAVTLNCLASMYRYAALDNIIVAAAGARSLAKCRALRLPCFDAATLVAAYSSSNGNSSNSSATAADARRNSPEWFQLVWLKTLVAHAVVSRGYDLLFADADTVFLKDATKAYTEFLDRYGADGTFMYEEANQTREDGTPYLNRYLNSGNFFLRSNARTKRMMSMWTVGYRFQVRSGGSSDGAAAYGNKKNPHSKQPTTTKQPPPPQQPTFSRATTAINCGSTSSSGSATKTATRPSSARATPPAAGPPSSRTPTSLMAPARCARRTRSLKACARTGGCTCTRCAARGST
jgi:hypothetical protein